MKPVQGGRPIPERPLPPVVDGRGPSDPPCSAAKLARGGAVTVEGRLQTRSLQAADGLPRRATEIVATALGAA